MKRSSATRELFMPWAGLVAGIVGIAVAHQFGSDGTFTNCKLTSPIPLLIVSLFCLLLVVIGALESWRVLRGETETPVRRVVAIVSVGSASLFVVAIFLPMIASLVLPPCFQ